MFELRAAGRTRVVFESWRLEDVNDAIAKVFAVEVDPRVVFDLAR